VTPPAIAPASWDDADGAALRTAQRAELDARYGSDDHEPGTPPSARDITVFLVARDPHSGAALGCGGLRDLGSGSAEIKRMYVVPERRGTGISVAILRALEEEARTRGIRSLLLETGTEQPDAMRFYEREGYAKIPNFGPYVGSDISICYARSL
jgi:putative acetyltransferase